MTVKNNTSGLDTSEYPIDYIFACFDALPPRLRTALMYASAQFSAVQLLQIVREEGELQAMVKLQDAQERLRQKNPAYAEPVSS